MPQVCEYPRCQVFEETQQVGDRFYCSMHVPMVQQNRKDLWERLPTMECDGLQRIIESISYRRSNEEADI